MADKMRGVLFLSILTAVAYFGGMFLLPPCLSLLCLPYGVYIAGKANGFTISTLYRLAPGLLEVVFGVKVKLCGNAKKLEGPCLLIMNHRTRFDWMFLWCYLIRMGDLQKLKIVLKDSIRKIPVVGWGLQASMYTFLTRKWAADEKLIKQMIGYYIAVDDPVQILFFPEGTDLSPSNKAKNHLYAEKHGLQKYQHVLHPRTKGFSLCVQEMRKWEVPLTVVNLSVGYVGNMPQNETDIASGNWPTEIHFFSELVPFRNLPASEEGLAQWLIKIWAEKERQLDYFYREKKFPAQYLSDARVGEAFGEMKKVMFVWCLFFLYIGYNMATSFFYWLYFSLWTTFYLLIIHCTKGIDALILWRHRLFS